MILIPSSVIREFRCALALIIFADQNIYNPVSPYVRASDASLWGGAFGQALVPDVKSFIGLGDFRGTRIRLDSLVTEYLPQHVSVSEGFPTGQYQWKVISQFKWNFPGHMVLFEAESFLLSLRNYCSKIKNCQTRFIQVFDAQSALGALAKGRSSSIRLNRVCRKCCALEVFADVSVVFAWCCSDKMPMDKASRVFAPRRNQGHA